MKNLGKRLVVILLALSMVLGSVSAIVAKVSAADVATTNNEKIESATTDATIKLIETEALATSKLAGTCGTNALWEYDIENKVLTITGTGEVAEIENEYLKTNAEKLVIGEGITSIGGGAYYCYNLTQVQLPETLTTINAMVFFGCEKLEEVVIPKSVNYIGNSAFGECYKLDKFTILGNVKTDGDIFCCAQPDVLELAGKMTKIGQVLLNGEETLLVKEIRLINDNPYYKWEGNYLLSADGTVLHYYLGFTNIVEVPESVTKIGAFAFFYKGVEEIKFNDKLKVIGNDAFYRCKIKNIEFPESLERIGKDAFTRNDMKTVKFNKNIKKICEGAFAGDNNIKKVKFYNNPKIVKGAFDKKVKIKYAKNTKIKGSFAFADYILDTEEKLYYVMLNINKVKGADGYQVKIYQPVTNMKVKLSTTKRLVLKKTDFELEIYEDDTYGTKLVDDFMVYAKVRPYQIVNGKRVYGEWSAKAKLDGYPNFFNYKKNDLQ